MIVSHRCASSLYLFYATKAQADSAHLTDDPEGRSGCRLQAVLRPLFWRHAIQSASGATVATALGSSRSSANCSGCSNSAMMP